MKKKIKDKFFTLLPDIYPISIHVAYSSDKKKVQDFFCKATDEPELVRTGKDIGVAASVAIFKQHLLFEFTNDTNRSPTELVGIVAHEACHATWFVGQELGTIFNECVQEPQCYLLQYIAQNILYHLWEADKK